MSKIPELEENDTKESDLNKKSNRELGLEILKAPKIIELDSQEKFKDNDNNIIEIETRGSRECQNIFFRVKDIETNFSINNLYSTLLHKNGSYDNNIDYKFFLCKRKKNSHKKTKKDIMRKELFLTYEGILRVLFLSRSEKRDNS